MKIVIDIIGAILEVMVANYIFTRVFEKRSNVLWATVINICCVGLFMLIATFLLNHFSAPLLTITAFILNSFVCKGNFLRRLAFSGAAYMVTMISEILVGATLALMYDVNIAIVKDNVFIYFQGVFLSKLLLIIVLHLLRLSRVRSSLGNNKSVLVGICIIPVSSFFAIFLLAKIGYKTPSALSSGAVLLASVLMLFSNIATFYLLENQIKSRETEEILQNLKEQYRVQKDYYSHLREDMMNTNRHTHDVKNFLSGTLALMETDKDLAESRIKEYCGILQKELSEPIETGNSAINALFQSKIQRFNDLILEPQIQIKLPSPLGMDELDLCILLGNMVDNALNALEKINDKNNRFLRIRVLVYAQQMSILVENSVVESTEKATASTAHDSIFHGFGLQNMRDICQRYDGDVEFVQKKNLFIVSALVSFGH